MKNGSPTAESTAVSAPSAVVYSALVATCSSSNVMVLPGKLGRVPASFAIDTGASVNLLSLEAYTALKRASRGGQWPLRPSDLTVSGVSSEPLDIHGIVRLPLRLGKASPALQLDFYVSSTLSVPSDGLLGFAALKSNCMTIYPDTCTVSFKGKRFKAMENPARLSTQWEQGRQAARTRADPAVFTVTASAPRRAAPSRGNKTSSVMEGHQPPSRSKRADYTADWKTVDATVVGSHEIPERTAAYVPVSVPQANAGCDLCLEGDTSPLKRLVIESTLNTVQEGNKTVALVVNTGNTAVKLNQGVLLCKALAFDKPVVSEPLELPSACVASVTTAPTKQEDTPPQTLESLVTTQDYPELRPSLLQFLQQYRDVIALPGEPLGVTDKAEHHIKLKPNTHPVYIPAYRLPHSQRKIVEEYVNEMLDQGVVKSSKSPWNSPIFLVPKKDGKYRPVIDFRKVNAVTEDDRYPLPVLKDLLMSLGQGNTIFSSLDLISGYWQVPMAPESTEITAFSTPQGHYEWLRMPFGLKSAPLTFQRLINNLFADLIGKDMFAYLDDLIICSKDSQSHFTTLKAVFQRLKEAGLKIKLSKCEFLKPKIAFLGHVVDGEGIHTMDDKTAAVKNFPRPQSVENVRSYLGLCGYYRSFIKNFAALASPLNQLLKKGHPFHWNAAQEKSFQDLKQALTCASVLAFPNYDEPFVLYTDASALGLGAVLMQADEKGKNRVIAYASRTLTPPERNYSVTHQETLAVVWALKHFRDVIFGYPVTVFTDHAAVTELFKGRNLSGRLARWYLTIQEFNPTFKYLPGRANVVADALSRNAVVGAVTDAPSPVKNFATQDLAKAQRQHDVWGKVIYALESGDELDLPPLPVPFSQFFLSPDGVLCRYWPQKRDPVTQFVIPEVYVPVVLQLCHDAVIAGHPGKERTLTAARRSYYWPQMRVDVDAYVEKCVKCAAHKGTVSRPAPILEYPPPSRPWEVVGIDLLQLPLSTQGSRYLLVSVDHFTRYVVLAPLKDKTAGAVAHALITSVFCPFSTPRVLLSDNGAEFRNALLEEVCTQYNVAQCFVATYHPASNGLVERANRKILEVLRPVVSGLEESWEDWIPFVAASINSSICESTGQSPYYILFGVEKRLPYDLLEASQAPVYDIEQYSKCQLKVFSDIHKEVQNRLFQSKAAMASQQHKRSSPVNIQVGDSVMVQSHNRTSKLDPKFLGPRLVTKQLTGNKFEILDPWLQTLEVVHSDRLKKTSAKPDLALAETVNTSDAIRLGSGTSVAPSQQTPTNTPHTYNLRSRTK